MSIGTPDSIVSLELAGSDFRSPAANRIVVFRPRGPRALGPRPGRGSVLALEGDETFEADAETERMLLQTIAQCEKCQTTPMTDLVSQLRRRE